MGENLNFNMSIGFYTTFELPSKSGRCNFYGCNKGVFHGGFCEAHGKIEIRGKIVDGEVETNQKGFKKAYK
jgi:hypothetical protein